MNLFEVYAKISLETGDYYKELTEADKKTSGVASTIKNGFKTAGKVAAVGLGAITGAVGLVAKKSLDAYADYEQLVGGIETLFGAGGQSIEEFAAANGKSVDEVRADYEKLMDSQEAVIENAENAYKTAGMSANEYMETVTGFSASLLQSLGNDTQAAAEYADRAVTDMSDNANKMGTDMELIQNAYQGFAKGNFTMLDNLKLGYGGTEEEMQRLIDHANEVKKANGDMAELSIDSFADVTEAIHIVQDEMGITGTTAEEASTTIQGSLSTAQGAWENLLTAFGDGNADLGQEVDNFVESVGQAAENIIPRIGEILGGIGELIPQLVPIIVDEIPGLIESLLPPVLDGMGQLVAALVENAPAIFQALVDAISDTLDTIGESLSEQIPALSPIFENLQAVVAGATAAFVAFKLAMAISSLIEKVQKGIEEYKKANEGATTAQALLNQTVLANPFVLIVTIIASLVAAIITLWNTNEDFRNAVQEIWEAIKGFFQAAWEAIKGVWETVTEFFSGIWEGIKEVFAAVGDWFSEKFQAAWDGIQEIWNAVVGFFSGIWEGIKEAFSAIGQWFSDRFTEAKDNAQNAWENVSSFFSGVWEGIKGAFSAVGQWFLDRFTEAKDNAQNAWDKVSGFFSGVWEGIKGAFHNVGSWFSEKFRTAKENASNAWSNVKSKFSTHWENIKSAFHNVGGWFSDTFSGAKEKAADAWDGIKGRFGDTIENLKDKARKGVEKLKGFFDFDWNLPKIKMPHFSITGKFSLNPLSVPHLTIDWYRKAMNNAMILNDPTIFGMSSSGDSLLGGGEAGQEVVAGADTLMNMISKAVKQSSTAKGATMNTTININISGANIQNDQELAERISFELRNLIDRRAAAFA